jgi:predicted LPLAT superfamily acyltransferase
MTIDKFLPCFVIPNFNHYQVFESVVDELLLFKIPIIVVNDGSGEETTELLARLDNIHESVSVIHLESNLGKGGAVKVGLFAAFAKGFTHAMQIDADGQHNLKDVEAFFSMSKELPEHLICGHPVYDENVPLGRLLPRYITHFWVWIETLSFLIKDSMCGFRVYPLAQTVTVIEESSIGNRMDFDIEILVRCFWRKIPLHFMPTQVIYPKHGVSHFRLFDDNWRISKMHCKLFFGMLVRSPKLLRDKFSIPLADTSRKDESIESSSENNIEKPVHWGATREKGSLLGLRFLVWSYKVFGKGFFRLLLHPVIAYFVLSSKVARESSRTFLQQLNQYQGSDAAVKFSQIYHHFYEFGSAALDKIACWMGDIRKADLVFHQENVFRQLLESGKGAVFIGAHLGNLELCRAIGEKSKEFMINAVVFNKHAQKFQQVLSRSNSQVELNLIHVEKMGADTAILLKQKVDQGEVVIIVGDRTSVSSFGRVEYADFLGKSAPFAQGPFILAGLLECPVYLLFCIKQDGKYNVYLEPFAESLRFPRKDRRIKLRECIEKYAARLTFYCQKSPYQWFNFYDFWRHDEADNVDRLRTSE